MPHKAHSQLPTVWFDAWLEANRTQNTPYGTTFHTEKDRPAEAADLLAEILYRSKTTGNRLQRLLQRVNWISSSARLDIPNTVQNQLGDFGEVVAIGVLEVFKGLYVPVVKLRYQMDKDQSLHGTDIVGFEFDEDDNLVSLHFCEVKTATSTKSNARAAVGAAHQQLADDRALHFTDTLEFLAERLDDVNPSVAEAFEEFLASREDGMDGSYRILLLTDPSIYDPTVIERIPEPPDLQEPLELDIVHVAELRALIEETWPIVAQRVAADPAKRLPLSGATDAD
ncbi:Hachiman antiphage defense system protein HamA [uncultured Nocardioides sp.]|uniref:Hachiman antiphage defense system protein HamA n=1 Tax=uncultured Nocardioides sp. TaxID=198441 RepID=UPI002635D889|nr:Hachiman antiphage defense system protein HamA [uncultured Nocardioides sp.]